MRTWPSALTGLAATLLFFGQGSSDGANEALVAAADSYEKAVVEKLNSDLESIGRAFADARDIQKARRWADWAKAPLATIDAVLGTLSIIPTVSSILSGLEKADNQVALLSYFFKLNGLLEAKDGVTLSIGGQDYQTAVGKMLAEADSARDKTAYQNTILLYLEGLDRRQSPSPIVVSKDGEADLLKGTKEFKARVRTLIGNTKSKLKDAPSLSGEEQRSIGQAIQSASTNVKMSKSKSVEVVPGLTLGRISSLELVRRDALRKYDTDMAIEQVNAISSAAGSICAVTSYFLAGGVSLTSVQHCSPISATGTLVKVATLTYRSSARREVDEVPFEMLLALPPEAASVWAVSSFLAEKVRSVVDRSPQRLAAGETSQGSQAATVSGSAPELTFRMKDGSTVSGQLQDESLQVKSSIGVATVPVKDIVSFSDGQLQLKDGSVLKGEITAASLKVASKYGKLELKPKDIAWFGVGKPPEAAVVAPETKPQAVAAKPSAPAAPAPGPTTTGSSIEGTWVILKQPYWVTNAWLAQHSREFQFLNDGTAIWGTATGTYQKQGANRIKVQFPMQAATPGYVGVLEVAIEADKLTLKSLAETDPVVLGRAGSSLVSGALARERECSESVGKARQVLLTASIREPARVSEEDYLMLQVLGEGRALDEVFGTSEKCVAWAQGVLSKLGPGQVGASPRPTAASSQLKDLAGRWDGITSGGFRFVWSIDEAGRYESVYQQSGREVRRRGVIKIDRDGTIRWSAEDGQRGSLKWDEGGSGTRKLRGTLDVGRGDTFELSVK